MYVTCDQGLCVACIRMYVCTFQLTVNSTVCGFTHLPRGSFRIMTKRGHCHNNKVL